MTAHPFDLHSDFELRKDVRAVEVRTNRRSFKISLNATGLDPASVMVTKYNGHKK